jgi:hypothetical protein
MNDPKYAAIPVRKYTMESHAPGVRWVVRNGERVLQQYWAIKTYENESCVGLHGEWRDVPTEAE